MNEIQEIYDKKKLINHKNWTIFTTKEAIFNRSSNVFGFCPFRKEDFSELLDLFKNQSLKMKKVLLLVNFIYAKKKVLDSTVSCKIQQNVLNYDNKLQYPLEISKLSGPLEQGKWSKLIDSAKGQADYLIFPFLKTLTNNNSQTQDVVILEL